MRGDLDQINLGDIFQTLAMSKMEGMLRVRNPLERRDVYFRNGLVRIVVPARIETRRLGELLVRAGVLSPEGLRSALIEQKKEHAPIGAILVDRGMVDPEQVEEVALGQMAEDLFALFTWRHGSFEFYKGQQTDAVRNLDEYPEFEVNAVLLEVARRSDEWAEILATLQSVEEIPTVDKSMQIDESRLSEQHLLLLHAIDGTQTYRDLAEVVLMSLFEAARTAKDLVERGLVDPAPTAQMLSVAAQFLDRGELKRALVTVQTLNDRAESHDVDTTVAMAELLKRSGEPRLAGRLLLQAAQLQMDPEEALALARQARSIATRDIEVLTFLRHTLASNKEGNEQELQDANLELVDTLLEEARAEEALAIVDEVQSSWNGDSSPLMMRKAFALHRNQQPQEAVTVLLGLAATYRAANQRKKLIEVYGLILKIDSSRRDIAKALRQLTVGRWVRMRRGFIAGSVLAILSGAGYWFWEQRSMQSAIVQGTATIADYLKAGERLAAQDALTDLIARWGPRTEFEELGKQIEFATAAERKRTRIAADKRRQERLNEAAELLESGQLHEALTLYANLHKKPGAGKTVESAVQVRLDALEGRLNRGVKTLPFFIPDRPGDMIEMRSVEKEIETIEKNFPDALQELVKNLVDAPLEDLPEIADVAQVAEIVAKAHSLQPLMERATATLELYRTARRRLATERRLDPLWKAAREHEAAFRFRAALDAYRELAKEHKGAMTPMFQEKVQKYATILRFLEVIEEATTRGNFSAAQSQYRLLRRAYGDIPFHEIVRLPLRVETRPPGALITVNDVPRGRSPVLLSYSPNELTVIGVKLEGFASEHATVKGDTVGLVRSLLACKADWELTVPGAIGYLPVIDSQGRAFVTDRSGTVSAFDIASGKPLWQLPTGDLSGLLPPGLIYREHLLLASLDGTLRAIDRASGSVSWEQGDLPTELRPALCGDLVVIATSTGKLVTVRASTGEIINRETLPGPVHSDLSGGARSCYFATDDGLACRFDPASGRIAWQERTGHGLASSPLVTSNGVVYSYEDGTIVLRDPVNGAARWQRTLRDGIRYAPCSDGKHLIVPSGRRMVQLAISDGHTVVTTDEIGTWSGPPALVRDLVLAPIQIQWKEGQRTLFKWNVKVMDAADLELRYQIRGSGAMTAAAAGTADGTAVLGFEDKRLLIYRKLP